MYITSENSTVFFLSSILPKFAGKKYHVEYRFATLLVFLYSICNDVSNSNINSYFVITGMVNRINGQLPLCIVHEWKKHIQTLYKQKMLKKIVKNSWLSCIFTAKIILERLGIQTSSSFVKIW